jgi:hypothetical protein
MIADAAFEQWVEEAKTRDMLSVAVENGAVLKRSGSEHVGACVVDGGKDSFAINLTKHVWNCRRGDKGGHDAISLCMHVAGLSFTQACEQLTGRPPPRGRSKPLSAEQKAEAELKRRARDRDATDRDREEAQRVARKAATAAEIWAGCKPIAGTLAEIYLRARGIAVPPMGWPDCLGFAKSLLYDIDPSLGNHPCLVARVDDVGEAITAIWRIYLSADGKTKSKLLPNAKLGLGPAGGGAVRIGGSGTKIGAAEGIETAISAWQIENYRFPVWATLSTSGMMGLDLPLEVERLSIYADADLPRRNKDGEMETDWTPPGLRAALRLRDKVKAFGVKAVIQELPFVPGRDFADVLKSCVAAENAA